MSGLRAECEVEQGVKQGRGIDGPFHNGLVGLSQGQKFFDGQCLAQFQIGQNVVEIEKLKGSSAGFVEQDHKKGHETEPELGAAEFAGAAPTDLH